MTRIVKLEIDAKVSGAINGLKTLGQATKDSAREFDKWAAKHEDSLETVGKGLAAFGLVAAGGATLAVKKFADFDKQMSSVQAATHETETGMGLLRQAAIDAGADTAFSAVEAAQGIEELAKAGVETRDVIGGGLTGALDLAAAGALSVGEAAEISATAMTQFKLSGDQIPHLADLLAAGAGKAQGSVSDLGAALNQSGLVASATGLSIEETTGTLAAFASAGLIGSDAGTSFKSMLQRLQNPSKQSADVMEELGINMYDANGEFAGMDVLAGQLATSLATKSSAERDAAMATMFGADAVRAANVLYQQGAQGIQDWTNKVNDAGYASETASIMQNNLAGDLEKLGGAFDTVFIQSGGAANDALRGLVQTAESFVDAVGQIPAPVLGIGTVLAGVAGGAALLAAGAINVLPKIRDTRDALKDLGITGRNTGKKIDTTGLSFTTIDAAMSKTDKTMRLAAQGGKLLGRAMTGVGASLVAAGILAQFQGSAKSIDEYTQAILRAKDATSGESPFNSDFFDIDFMGVDAVKGIEDAFAQIKDVRIEGGGIGDWVNDAVFNLTGYKSSINAVEEALGQYDSAVAGLASGGNTEAAATAFTAAAKAGEAQGLSLKEVSDQFPLYLDHLRSVASESKIAVSDQEMLEWALSGIAPAAVSAASGLGGVEAAMSEVGAEAEVVAASLEDILASLFELGRDTRSVIEAEDALTGSLKTLKESVKENGKEFEGNSKAALANRAALVGVAADMESVVEAQARGGASSGEIAATMKGTYDAMMTATGGSEELVRSLLSIPPGVNVETYMDGLAKEIAAGTADAIEAIPGYKKVEVVVSEDGTAGQVQSKVNEVTGKTEYVLVSENGTTATVQAGIANIKGKDVPVWVDDNGTVYSTSGKIQGIKGKDVTIVASAQTATAEAQLNNAARDRSSVINTRVVTTKVTHETTGAGGRGGITRASGGSVFGSGTETSDSIPAWLSNNEHVLSAQEVRGLGGHGAVERLRAEARMGNAPAFKNGGAVGSAEAKVKSTKRAYELIDGKKANRLRKLAAKDQYDAAKKELADAKKSSKASEAAAKKAETARKKAAEDEKARRERVGELQYDTRRDLRRGDIGDAFTSGSGLGQIDKLFDLSRNKDLSSSQRKAAGAFASKAEPALLKLEKRAESVEKALDKAVAKRNELLDVQNRTQGSVLGTFDLNGMSGQKDAYGYSKPVNKKNLLSFGKERAASAMKLRDKVARLQKVGFKPELIQMAIDEWTSDGTFEIADAFTAMKLTEVRSMNNSFASVSTSGAQAGEYLTRSMVRGGEDAARGVVQGLESQQKKVDAAFAKMGRDGEKAFRKSLDMHSPSRSLAIGGRDAVDGVVLGVDSNAHKLESAMFGLGAAGEAAFNMSPAFSVPPSPEVARYAAQPAGAILDYDRLAQALVVAVQAAPVQAKFALGRQEFASAVNSAINFTKTH